MNKNYQLAGIKRKQISKNLRAIAKHLPLTYFRAMEYSYRTGAQILEDDKLVHLHDSIKNPEAHYRLEKEVMHPVNHAKRMKTLLKYSVKAVQKYIEEMQRFAAEMQQNNMPFVINDIDMWIKARIVKSILEKKTSIA